MTVWVDAQLSPEMAPWIHSRFKVDCLAIKDLGLRDAADELIFQRAKEADCIVMTKDKDFVELLQRNGPPPSVLWITTGNTSNLALMTILERSFSAAIELISRGEALVEISGR